MLLIVGCKQPWWTMSPWKGILAMPVTLADHKTGPMAGLLGRTF